MRPRTWKPISFEVKWVGLNSSINAVSLFPELTNIVPLNDTIDVFKKKQILVQNYWIQRMGKTTLQENGHP